MVEIEEFQEIVLRDGGKGGWEGREEGRERRGVFMSSCLLQRFVDEVGGEEMPVS